MKSAHRIAIECSLGWQQIRSIIEKENIIPALIKGRNHYFDQYQEEHIHNILFFTCMVSELTFESKMNKESKETLQDFEEMRRKRSANYITDLELSKVKKEIRVIEATTKHRDWCRKNRDKISVINKKYRESKLNQN